MSEGDKLGPTPRFLTGTTMCREVPILGKRKSEGGDFGEEIMDSILNISSKKGKKKRKTW